MRAATNSLGCDLAVLEGIFCQPDEGSTITPNTDSAVYQSAAQSFEALL